MSARAAGFVAVVGATGVVGAEALEILASRGVPARRVRALASGRIGGRRVKYGGAELPVESLGEASFEGVSAALFAADASTAREHVPRALGAGATVVDNSSAFRMERGVPLVIPEVNGELLGADPSPRLVANPNCSTILLLTALEPWRRRFGVGRVVVSTYQAVSGAGAAAIGELMAQTGGVISGGEPVARVFHEPCAFNLFSHDSAVDGASGLNVEERKIIEETGRIWGEPGVRVSPTCIRVPVVRAHSEAVWVELREAASVEELRGALCGAPGLSLVDDRAENRFPTPLRAAGGDAVLVGRVRHDPAHPADARGRSRHACLWLCGDQVRKGAALNAVQILEGLGRLGARSVCHA